MCLSRCLVGCLVPWLKLNGWSRRRLKRSLNNLLGFYIPCLVAESLVERERFVVRVHGKLVAGGRCKNQIDAQLGGDTNLRIQKTGPSTPNIILETISDSGFRNGLSSHFPRIPRSLEKEHDPLRTFEGLTPLNRQAELNGSSIDELQGPPTALQFSRLVHISRPVKFSSTLLDFLFSLTALLTVFWLGHLAESAIDFPALHIWTNEYLKMKMGCNTVSVALTPNGCVEFH